MIWQSPTRFYKGGISTGRPNVRRAQNMGDRARKASGRTYETRNYFTGASIFSGNCHDATSRSSRD